MKTSVCLALLYLAFTLSGCQAEPVSPEIRQQSSEELNANPPVGWTRVYQMNSEGSRISEFVPEGETAIKWTAKLTFESFKELIEADPIQLLVDEANNDRELCSFVQHFNLFSGLENNYPTSVRLYLCGERGSLEQGEVKVIKAIKGAGYFYIVRLVSRIPPFEVNQPEFARKTMATWSSYLATITLCNRDNPNHPCEEESDKSG